MVDISTADCAQGGGRPALLWNRLVGALAQEHVIVLSGGVSGEREVSLQSGAAMLDALSRPLAVPQGADVESLPRFSVPVSEPGGGASVAHACPASVHPIEIDAGGLWCWEGHKQPMERALERVHPRSIFMLGLHGGAGEDGRLQSELAQRGFRYTGSGASASALCMDKAQARRHVTEAGLLCAEGHCVSTRLWQSDPEGQRMQVRAIGGSAWFVKPNGGGSSVGVVRASSEAELWCAVESVIAGGDDALVEAEVSGLEVTVGVIGSQATGVTALPVCEIIPKQGHFFDYDEKYTQAGAVEYCPPRMTPPEVSMLVQSAALQAYQALGCRGYARVDFILPRSNTSGPGQNRALTAQWGPPVFLEANTLPGMTDRSLVPLAAQEAGLDMQSLCLEILAQAITYFRNHE